MAITLDQFRTISNGTHNVGQIMLNDDGNGLQKINNHIWKTKKNDVQTNAAQNRAVRQALYDAFANDGNYSFERLDDIEEILLGGGNASRSLSRDFVKKLFEMIGKRQRGVSIVGDMNKVSKSLSERKVSVVNAKGLVTSSRAAAYEIYASEQMDACSSEGREGYKMIKDAFQAAGGLPDNNSEPLLSGLEKIKKSLRDMVLNDKRLIGMEKKKEKILEELDLFTSYARLNMDVAHNVDGLDSFVAMLKQSVGNMYSHAGVEFRDIAEDHLARIFPTSASGW